MEAQTSPTPDPEPSRSPETDRDKRLPRRIASIEEISELLYERASPELKRTRTREELSAVSATALACLEGFAADRSVPNVITETAPDRARVFVALEDRPFIVSTIAECARQAGVKIVHLLHPTIADTETSLSLCYLETPPARADEIARFESLVRERLSDLTLVTSDFEAMQSRSEALSRSIRSGEAIVPEGKFSQQDVSSFLRWIGDENMIYLGYAKWGIQDGRVGGDPSESFGILRSSSSCNEAAREAARSDCQSLLERSEAVGFSKTDLKSPVHRMVRTSDVVVQELSPSGEPVALHSFVGLLTSKALGQETSTVPLIRSKLQRLIRAENISKSSHDYKTVVDIVDGMPKETALRLDLDSLRELVAGAARVKNQDETSLAMTVDAGTGEASVLVSMFRERLDERMVPEIKGLIEKRFGALTGSADHHVDLTTYPFARLYVRMSDVDPGSVPDKAALEADVAVLVKTWDEKLSDALSQDASLGEPSILTARYRGAFLPEYKAATSPADCVTDIRNLEALSAESPVKIDMDLTRAGADGILPLTVYSREAITVSRALPILESAGFEVLNERCSTVQPDGADPSYIHTFRVRAPKCDGFEQTVVDEIVEPGLEAVFCGRAENDRLNSLMIEPGLTLHQVGTIRTLGALLWQLNRSATKEEIADTLVNYPRLAAGIVEMVTIKFDASNGLTKEERLSALSRKKDEIEEGLSAVKDIQQDRVFRNLLNLIDASVRANFFEKAECNAIKIHSRQLEFLAQPRPLFEIFVYSPEVEGIHLRGGKVSRGGIRWSDRHQDYRTEILDLMKTQVIKNAFIVPTGAKGGFVVKKMPSDPAAVPDAVQKSYSSFVRSLLSLTDNRSGGKIVQPERLVIYDDPDPYLVVAADKGTARFSDVANKLARDEFDFWLGDAFASGGSNGYDHKALGITARGAWECAKRHFKNKGIDYQSQPFTVIGIGDMSGDVFGNGLMQSDKMKLVAAFNHKHIFVDPNPDPARSFEERKRLFEMPRSQWSDYAADLISKGGGVFERNAKEIELSDEARAAIGIPPEAPRVMNGEQIIAHILKAPVDLLWNGGIGTYVKSSGESNADVGDGTNDRVRVNATDLRAKVIAEGGNLGFTQQARVELAAAGGAINTDAIDNSGGVGMSDIEVNIKILLAGELREGRIDDAEYKRLIAGMADEAVEKVLKHNRDHALALTIGELRSQKHLDYFQGLVAALSRQGYLNRALNQLPTDDEFQERARKREGLTRPELSVVLAAVKMWTKDMLLESDLLEDPMTRGFLFDYFPEGLRDRFADAVQNHPLRKEIVATQICNYLADAVGMTFVHRISQMASVPPTAVVKAGLAADLLIDAGHLRSGISSLDAQRGERFLDCRAEVHQALRDTTAWLVEHHGNEASPERIVGSFKDAFIRLVDSRGSLFRGYEKEIFDRRFARYEDLGLDQTTRATLALAPVMPMVLEMLWISEKSGKDIETTASVFTQILSDFDLTRLLEQSVALNPDNRWEKDLLEHSSREIRASVSKLTMELLEAPDHSPQSVAKMLREKPGLDDLRETVADIRRGAPTPSAMSAIVRQLNRAVSR